ncbi:MAG: hypothetical protein EPO20_21325 [Betaproteobacteria bacterium]|nr:MAG: hypothetical protein EPO20_21325 [Betaproteobacteria bacterium]
MESPSLPLSAALFLMLGAAARFGSAAGLELAATIPMPAVKGRIDHLAADVQGRRLFVAALGNNTVEVLDVERNRHVKSLAGFNEPQGVLYVPQTNRLYVANGNGGRVDILNAASLLPIKRIEELDDADNVRYDAARHTVIVGYGKGALRILQAGSGESAGDVRLEGHPEAFQLERKGPRVLINVPDARQIAVVDRGKQITVAAWNVPAARNFPMALDEEGRRLFVGARSPAVMLVYDADSGKVVAKAKIGADTDDLFFDAVRKRIYVICGAGRLDVFRQESPDRYIKEDSVKTAPRARTGLFVPEDEKLYVAAPAAGSSPARVLVYRVR